MPIYEYICNECHHKFDALRSMKEADSPIECNHCHGKKTTRSISVFYAQSSGQVVAGGNGSSCGSCSSSSCAGCRN
jgi:putative FmdB family regulatory protein